jgi:hypothetical protein
MHIFKMSRQKLKQILSKRKTVVEEDKPVKVVSVARSGGKSSEHKPRLDDELPAVQTRKRYQDASDSDEPPKRTSKRVEFEKELARKEGSKTSELKERYDSEAEDKTETHENNVEDNQTQEEQQMSEEKQSNVEPEVIERTLDITADVQEQSDSEDDNSVQTNSSSKRYQDSDEEKKHKKRYLEDHEEYSDEDNYRQRNKQRDSYEDKKRISTNKSKHYKDESDKIEFIKVKNNKRRDYSDDEYEEDIESENRPFDHVPKNVIVKFLKNLNSSSGTDTVQAVLIVLNEIVFNLFFKILSKKDDNVINMRDIKELIITYVEEEELPEDVFIASKLFEIGIRNVCEESKCVLKRESVLYTHLFTEWLLMKIVNNAFLIAKNARRNRISGKDILLAYNLAMF